MIFIYVPCQNLDTAKAIAKILVQERMAGKVDIMLTSSFSLVNGEAVDASGATMIIKTIDRHIQGIEEVVMGHHKDSTPCVATIALSRMNREFKDWLLNATS
jgi:uncharacterized protein involved in tolerance to divalent cations